MVAGAVAAAAYAGYLASEAPSTASVAVAGSLAVLALVLWAIRAGSSNHRLSITRGQLEVLTPHGRFVFDLSSDYTRLEVTDSPGRRGWKVQFLRRGMSPFTIDASRVDPQQFMLALRAHRPELEGQHSVS